MFKKIQALVLLCSTLVWTSGCNSQSRQEEFEDQAFGETPSGFVRTLDGEEILSEDSDDWRTAPVFETDVIIRPASPNPVAVSGFVSIFVSILRLPPGRLYAYTRNASGRLERLTPGGTISHSGNGFQEFRFSAGLLGERGLHRLFIFDEAGVLISYGDVMVE